MKSREITAEPGQLVIKEITIAPKEMTDECAHAVDTLRAWMQENTTVTDMGLPQVIGASSKDGHIVLISADMVDENISVYMYTIENREGERNTSCHRVHVGAWENPAMEAFMAASQMTWNTAYHITSGMARRFPMKFEDFISELSDVRAEFDESSKLYLTNDI